LKASPAEPGNNFGADVFPSLLVEMSKQNKTQKGGKKGSKGSKGRKTRKGSKWTDFVKKIYTEMKKKDKNVKLGAAMKEASKRKSEME